MKFVLDSSVAFKTLVPETESDKAIKLLDEYRQGIHELLAPDILPVEVGHALTRVERQGRVSPTNGYALWSSLMADCPPLVPYLTLMSRAYLLSSQFRIGVYDCLYVALAEREGCELLTADQRLLNTFQAQFPIVHVSSL
jgi:predicted nucleic acid-binding protein